MKKYLFLTIVLLCMVVQGAWAQTSVSTDVVIVDTDAKLRTAFALCKVIQLDADIDLDNKTLSIENGTTVTIDLNGHTLDRKLTQRGEGGGQVITVRSGATLNLSNGTLKGGWGGNSGGICNEGGTANLTNVTITGCTGDDRGGGICNLSGSKLVMEGGAITNNKSNDHGTPSGGGGIFNAEGAAATLTNVTITGNEAIRYGGGGINNFGTLTLNGCTITGNTSKANGGGVWTASSSTLNMQGKNTVTDNTREGKANNVFLRAGVLINVTGDLADSNVGIGMEYAGTFTNGYSAYHSGVAPSTFFSEDTPSHNMILLDGEGCFSLDYLERSWDSENKKVITTMKTLTEEIGFNDIPTNEYQYKVLTPECDDHDHDGDYEVLDLGTKDCPYHEYYVVKDDMRFGKLYLVGPNVHIIICDNVTFSPDGVSVVKGTNFYLHAQSDGANMGRWHSDVLAEGCIGSVDWKMYNNDIYRIKEGGNIEIHGCDIKIEATYFFSCIGGQYEKRHGDVTIFGGKIHAVTTGYAAAIGGGGNCKDAGTVTIYDGKIEAHGGPSGGGGAGIGGGWGADFFMVHIHGGDITAYGGRDAAGIGSAQFGDYNGTVIIDGGTVKAYGDSYGAGIGGGDSQNGGTITINGGHVEAYGGTDAAGIGGGEGGDGGKVTITGGYVYAEGGWEYGAGIGGGQDGAGANVTITGGTVIAKSGQLGATGMRAIGPGYGSSDFGRLTIGDGMMVRNWNCTDGPYPAALRRDYCWYRTQARLDPCTHEQVTYTVSGTSISDTHTAHCAYCTTQFDPETHTFDTNDVCTACGVQKSTTTYTVSVYLPRMEGGYDNPPLEFQMIDGTEFNMPPAPNENIPVNLEFAGWLEGAPASMDDIETDGSETLLPVGAGRIIHADAVFTARYQKISLTLDDGDANSEAISRYNDKQASSVTISGRTLYKDNSWNTLCLPFNVVVEDSPLVGATVMELDVEGWYDTDGIHYDEEAEGRHQTGFNPSDSTLYFYFKDAEEMVAGRPYIIKWAGGSDITSPTFSNVTIKSSDPENVESKDGKVSFLGNYDPAILTDDDASNLYLGSGNQLYWPKSTEIIINSFRAFFHVDMGGESQVRAFRLNLGEDAVTDMRPLSGFPKWEGTEASWYDLQGRKLNGKPTRKGIYIHNGKKVVME